MQVMKWRLSDENCNPLSLSVGAVVLATSVAARADEKADDKFCAALDSFNWTSRS